MDNLSDEDAGVEDVNEEDVKTASTILMVSAVQLIGILLLLALLCLAKRKKAIQWFNLEERDKPPPYEPPPSFNAAMKMSEEFSAIRELPIQVNEIFFPHRDLP